LSTTGIMNYVAGSSHNEFIIGTENEITFILRKKYPDKIFHTVTDIAVCPNMKKNTLEKVLWTLQEMKNEIKVPEEIRVLAYKPIKKMLDL